jgi:hypothetical protein
MFCIANEDVWLKFKVDRAESNRDTWFCNEDLTDANEDSQWSNLVIKDSTGMDVMQVTGSSCSENGKVRSPVSVRSLSCRAMYVGGVLMGVA